MNKVQQHEIYSELEVTQLFLDLLEYDSQYLTTILQFDRIISLDKFWDDKADSLALEIIMWTIKKSLMGKGISTIKKIGNDKIIIITASRNASKSKQDIINIILSDDIIPIEHLNVGHLLITDQEEPFLIKNKITDFKLSSFTDK